MKKSILHILFLLIVGTLSAQEVGMLFDQANTSYREGNYQEALLKYHQIDSLGKHSADLYYNLGNTYYKLNQIGPSIYYFEKALVADSDHKDAKHNLVFAQRMTIDAFEELPKNIFQKFNEKVIYPTPYNTWAWVSVVLSFLIALFFLLYYFSNYSGRKRLFFT
ncbi:MAG TPA: tetratricopeptide repeat protein, partial [Flavobacteriaceae bacterium]|nr:tetratricopeptide repeat protein [Flavobacteriaceae bacterium]